ncbi:MAG: radical SAM protein [Proteobacteria bacterium]|nr:radical SAM protein [Pseudomonadota bacterium]
MAGPVQVETARDLEPADTTNFREFRVILVKPSRYDDDGYVVQWFRSAVPSNTLATVHGLFEHCGQRGVFGEDVRFVVESHDETNTRIRPERIAARLQAPGVRGLVGLVGVQSNQYPRAMDLARSLRALGVPVCMGGFHISGSLAMLPGVQPELQEALDLGVALFAGEAEADRVEEIVRDAARGKLGGLYDYSKDLPELSGAPVPGLPKSTLQRTVARQASFDAGRGCPFQCSFCTIINVQGRKSRHRSPDDVEAIVRSHFEQGVSHFFITDDNFARNRNWEAIFDRLIALRESDKIKLKLTIQVDTLCHRIPGFIEKAGRAGVKKVFIGLENINPESLKSAKKKQNRLSEYRAMMQAWHRIGVLTYAGYIIGFPADTAESIQRDIETIQRELPIDILEFFNLTPLPGSADHQRLFNEGTWMEPDLNRYDLDHVTMDHARMSREGWQEANRLAWRTYYSWEHMETLLRRACATGIKPSKMARMILWFHGSITYENIHPLESGYFRRRHRRDRRPTLPRESVWRFYPKRAAEVVRKVAQLAGLLLRLELLQRRVQREAAHTPYTDAALTPDTEQLDWSSEAAARPPSQPVPLRVTSAANAPERDRASA